ncbi:YbhB/YbcL family Raf kinase inhibitor-like protein [Labrys monachus]|uniref:Raf kinase inhibitor-like YbhB/YbcL family protein n=1 Tax=Labrys monachus TaxID=217067 RepID=A0ABU0FHY6_9HYPH|nr:YbhB/YbcL family Raf kinase inhibitor-like protein [Labrys monachus]MDQ0394224.1 Raf kinase inhibitor-like YbhB/YbcL family protein [Labrys monachus]
MKYFAGSIAALGMLTSTHAFSFELTSPDIRDGGTLKSVQVADVFGCSGGNISPELRWSHAPAGTRSFVVTLYDPDAPTGSGWWHWTVFDIPASARSIPAGAGAPGGKGLPAGSVQGHNDAGLPQFQGACPPPGPAHRYVLTITALKVARLGLGAEASGAMIGFMTRANALGSASIIATYAR